MAHEDIIGPKNQKFSIELGEKLGHQFKVKFHGELNGNSLDALKRCSDPEMGHRSLVYGQKLIESKFCLEIKLDHHLEAKNWQEIE